MWLSLEKVKCHQNVNHSVTFDPSHTEHTKHDYQNHKYGIQMHTTFHWLQNEVWYRGLRQILLMLWLFSSGKTQKIGCIYRIWVLKFIRASWQEWPFLSNRSSDHDVSHIKQNYPISSRCYKRPHVDIFICVAKKLNWNRGILNERPVYRSIWYRPPQVFWFKN